VAFSFLTTFILALIVSWTDELRTAFWESSWSAYVCMTRDVTHLDLERPHLAQQTSTPGGSLFDTIEVVACDCSMVSRGTWGGIA